MSFIRCVEHSACSLKPKWQRSGRTHVTWPRTSSYLSLSPAVIPAQHNQVVLHGPLSASVNFSVTTRTGLLLMLWTQLWSQCAVRMIMQHSFLLCVTMLKLCMCWSEILVMLGCGNSVQTCQTRTQWTCIVHITCGLLKPSTHQWWRSAGIMTWKRFQFVLCDSVPFFMVVFSSEENNWLKPNCSQPPPQIDTNTLVAESCKYAEWKNLRAITPEQISVCIQNDEVRFINEVCVNHTIVTELVQNSANAWVEQYCTHSIRNPPTSPPPLSIEVWCNYSKWTNMSVDPSVVALCWQYDQIGFHQNVCCNIPLYDKLSLHVDNQWLIRECSDNDTKNVLEQVCVYSDWSQPTIVDMTELALCADLDTENFTRNVCANATVLQNLLANLDNTWLLEQCTNLTASGPGGGAGNGGSLMGFRPGSAVSVLQLGFGAPGCCSPSLFAGTMTRPTLSPSSVLTLPCSPTSLGSPPAFGSALSVLHTQLHKPSVLVGAMKRLPRRV